MSEDRLITIHGRLDKEDERIAQRLKSLRERLDVDLNELAEAANLDSVQLTRYEAALEPIPASDLLVLSVLLGTEMEYFFEDNDVMLPDGSNDNVPKEGRVLPLH